MLHLTYLMVWKGRISSIALRRKLIIAAGLLLFLAVILTVMALASGQEADSGATGKNLSLDVYLYNTGKTLVAGYIDNVDDLPFLKPTHYTPKYTTQYTSKYAFDHQLYVWTDALTLKQGENWKLIFPSLGFYGDYHIIFHLPSNLMLGRINSSKGLNYLVLVSNDSLTVDAQGYNVRDPTISVEYQQTLEEYPPNNISIGRSSYNFLLIIGTVFILAIGLVFAFIIRRRKEKLQPKEIDRPEAVKIYESQKSTEAVLPLKNVFSSEKDQQAYVTNEEDELNESTLLVPQLEGISKKIEISDKMNAIMETLTPRERAILKTLIKHGGRMTQLEIRYETDSPKSSVAMILISLEKRKLITKKEFGRTNIVELSEWFLSGK